MSPDQKDYYAILGITREASQEDIKRAYFQAAQKLHPDKNVAAGETELFMGVQQAYEVLSNPKRRSAYDATLPPQEKINLPYRYQFIFPAMPRCRPGTCPAEVPADSRRNRSRRWPSGGS